MEMYGARLPLRVDVMWTCGVDKWVGLLKAIVVVVFSYNVAVASLKDEEME